MGLWRRTMGLLEDLSWVHPRPVEWSAQRALLLAAQLGSQAAVDELWRVVRFRSNLYPVAVRLGRPASADSRERQTSLIALGDDAAEAQAVGNEAADPHSPFCAPARRRILDQRRPTDIDMLCAVVTHRLAHGPAQRYHWDDNWTDQRLEDDVAFCIAHELHPSDEAARTHFFLLTHQVEHRIMLDPRGTLLAAAYRDADTIERRAILAVLATEGDLPLLGRLIGEDTGRQPQPHESVRNPVLTPDDNVGRLLRTARDRGDLAGLWAAAAGLPPDDLMACVAALAIEPWQPDDPAERWRFDRVRLATERPRRRRTVWFEQGRRAYVQQFTATRFDDIVELSFAPDDTAVAAIVRERERYRLVVLSLAEGEIVDEYAWRDEPPHRVLHLNGDALLVARWRKPDTVVERYERGRVTPLETFPGHVEQLAAVGDGYAVLQSRELRQYQKLPFEATKVVVDPGGAWLAVGGEGVLLLDPRDGTILDHDDARCGTLCTAGPGRLATLDTQQLHVWHITQAGLQRTATIDVPDSNEQLAYLPSLNAFAVGSRQELRYLTAEGAVIEDPDGYPQSPVAGLWSSTSGALFATTGPSTLRIYHTCPPGIAALADRPVNRLTPADRATIEAAFDWPDPPGVWRPTLLTLEAFC